MEQACQETARKSAVREEAGRGLEQVRRGRHQRQSVDRSTARAREDPCGATQGVPDHDDAPPRPDLADVLDHTREIVTEMPHGHGRSPFAAAV
jgi:hypothetical protein